MSGKQHREGSTYDYHAAPTEDTQDGTFNNQSPHEMRLVRRRSKWQKALWMFTRLLLASPLIILMLFGILHITLVLVGRTNLFWDLDQYKPYLPQWGQSGQVGEDLSKYPTDATRDVKPIPCHSHNDYWRRVPLFDAIHCGCISVEVDVWHFDGDEELYVGHDTASLTSNRTLTSLYINPLVGLLDSMNPSNKFGNTTGNGVFDEEPNQTLILLVDFKTNGRDLFPQVHKQLEPLREKHYLSYWNGQKFMPRAITVVGSGNAPFDLITANKDHRDIFFDAPLDKLNDDYDTSNSYYASVSFDASLGSTWLGGLKEKQLDLIRKQIRGAHQRGLKARYWETPSWPTSLRNHIWETLLKEGVDVLNVDDLQAAASLDWNHVKHDWFDGR